MVRRVRAEWGRETANPSARSSRSSRSRSSEQRRCRRRGPLGRNALIVPYGATRCSEGIVPTATKVECHRNGQNNTECLRTPPTFAKKHDQSWVARSTRARVAPRQEDTPSAPVPRNNTRMQAPSLPAAPAGRKSCMPQDGILAASGKHDFPYATLIVVDLSRNVILCGCRSARGPDSIQGTVGWMSVETANFGEIGDEKCPDFFQKPRGVRSSRRVVGHKQTSPGGFVCVIPFGQAKPDRAART
jgi:hypothetical protein